VNLVGADDLRRPPSQAKIKTSPQLGQLIDLPKQDRQLPMNLLKSHLEGGWIGDNANLWTKCGI